MESQTIQLNQRKDRALAFAKLAKIPGQAVKTSFLVFKANKYFIVAVDKIAFFSIRHESTMITCFDREEYFVKYSLDQIQNLLADKQFYRLNRQYLINVRAIKDVEHYFARKLLVNPTIIISEKLLVAKEKAGEFLSWLDNR